MRRKMGKSIFRTYGAFITAFILTFYGLGASIVDQYVIYPTFPVIGENEFVAYRAVFGPRIVLFMVLPLILQSVFSILLLWLRPKAIPLWTVWLALACQLVRWGSTVVIQLPIQAQLERGKNLELISTLMHTSWIRTLANVAVAAIMIWMMFAVLRSLLGVSNNTSAKV
jgi:hypothetical protein